jgi:hypothetical protein
MSVVKPCKAYSLTYDGPRVEKSKVEEILSLITEKYTIEFSIEVDESFP